MEHPTISSQPLNKAAESPSYVAVLIKDSKIMANQGYFPSSEADRTAWLAHFRTKLPVHCVNLGFSEIEILIN